MQQLEADGRNYKNGDAAGDVLAHSPVLAPSLGAVRGKRAHASGFPPPRPAGPTEKPAPEVARAHGHGGGRWVVSLAHAHVASRGRSREPHCSPHSPATKARRAAS
jgi:hypothetical protein